MTGNESSYPINTWLCNRDRIFEVNFMPNLEFWDTIEISSKVNGIPTRLEELEL